MGNLLLSFGSVMQTIGYVVLAIVVLLVMITVHEFGHYTAGKIFKFGINEFAIGFGPKIFSRTSAKTGEVFSVRCLPIGGFCSFKGEDEDDPDPSAFNNKKPWQRIIVLISGALMNYLLALLLIFIMFGAYGQSAYYVKALGELSPEQQAMQTLEEGDVILKINGKNIYMASDMMNAIKNKKTGDTVTFLVVRDGVRTEIAVELVGNGEFTNIEDTNQLLTAIGVNSLYSTNVKHGFFTTIGHGIEYSFRVAGTIFTVLGQLLTGKLGLGAIGGTITTVTITADAIRSGGLNYLLMISSYIGVNLAVFNLLPIPALDGSRVVFTAIEWVRKKPLNRKVEGAIHFAGLILIVGFALLVDLLKLF